VFTLLIQDAAAIVFVALAFLAVRVPRADPKAPDWTRMAWRMTGVGYLLVGADNLLHLGWGTSAFFAGPASSVMGGYLRWTMGLNQSRTFLMIGLSCGLLALAFRRRAVTTAFRYGIAALFTVALLGGLATGAMAGSFFPARDLPSIAIGEVCEVVLEFAAAFALLLRNRVDRFLWAFLTAYAFSVSLEVFWLIDLTQRAAARGWTLPLWTAHAVRLGFHLAMLGIVWRRLALARAGKPVQPILGSGSLRVWNVD
jgi:hypothetical protein